MFSWCRPLQPLSSSFGCDPLAAGSHRAERPSLCYAWRGSPRESLAPPRAEADRLVQTAACSNWRSALRLLLRRAQAQMRRGITLPGGFAEAQVRTGRPHGSAAVHGLGRGIQGARPSRFELSLLCLSRCTFRRPLSTQVSGFRYVLHPFAAKYSHWMWH
jgi:hypothetical protein